MVFFSFFFFFFPWRELGLFPRTCADCVSFQANIYWGEGDLTQAYILMYRASDLVLKNVRLHPEYASPEGRKLLKEVTSQAHQVIRDLEVLKPLVEAQHDEWERTIGARKRIWNGHYEESPPSKKQFSPKVLDARDQENQSLNQVLKNVNRRSATIRRPARSYTIDYDEKRRGNVYDKWDPPILRSTSPEVEIDEDETRRQMEAARRTLDFTDPKRFLHDTEGMDSSYATYAPSYPTLRPSLPIEVTAESIPHLSSPPLSPLTAPHSSQSRDDQEELPTISPQQSPRFNPPPPVPQKSQLRDRSPPPRPEKILIERRPQVSEEPPPQAHSELESNDMSGKAPAPPPKVGPEDASPRSEKNDVVFQTADYLESGEPLRSLFIAKDLRAKFLRIAEPNTAKGLELCGLLCGQLYKNALFATRLLIPEQVCTENTCDTVNEERIWEFCDEHDVLVMGWIHTHPTQTCFLSSRDLHTHAVYQVQLPESVAIVCAPKFNEYVFLVRSLRCRVWMRRLTCLT